jgi:serine/threonine protein phosphatase 1
MEAGRILAIGDIHGCSRALDGVLEMVAPTEQDHLIFLGDYVDRGPDSRGVIERLCGLSLTHKIVPLMGNHEVMMLSARRDISWARDWLRVGGLETLDSYGAQTTNDIPESHWNFLNACLPYYETDTHIFVHAGADPEWDMEDQTDDNLYWVKFHQVAPHKSWKTIICGHTAQKTGIPLDKGFAICIDTWVYGEGWLTCLDVINRHVWQASQSGARREGEL